MTRSVFHSAYQEMLSALRKARKSRGVTQIELAARLGMPQSFVSKYESGDRRIDVVELLMICRALELEPDEVLNAVLAQLNQ